MLRCCTSVLADCDGHLVRTEKVLSNRSVTQGDGTAMTEIKRSCTRKASGVHTADPEGSDSKISFRSTETRSEDLIKINTSEYLSIMVMT